MSITKNIHGAWVISTVVSGFLFTKQYYFYTKHEAILQFRNDLKTFTK